MRLLCLIALLSAPSCTAEYATGSSAVLKDVPYIGKTELGDRQELIDFLDVDPVNTEWCAAFVNSVLEESNIPSNKDHQHPLMARAFLDWGLPDFLFALIHIGQQFFFYAFIHGWRLKFFK